MRLFPARELRREPHDFVGASKKKMSESNELQQELQKLKDLMEAQEKLRGVLPDAQIDQILNTLKEKYTAIKASLKGSGAVAQGKVAVAAGQEGVAVGKDVHGNVIVINVNAASLDPDELWRLIKHSPPSLDLRRSTERFVEALIERYRYLDFRGMGVSDRVPLKLPLLEMYVPLKARSQLPKGETWARQLKLAGRTPSEAETKAMGERLSEPQPVLDILTEYDGLIILGDPGAGKTTFLKFLTLALATGQGGALGLGARLPILLPLADYATELATEDIPLDRFIADYYRRKGVDLPLDAMLTQALGKGGALLLLDGLDEVRERRQRHLVVNRVTDFYSFHKRAGNKFVLTSRVVGYPEVRPEAKGLAECTIVDFEDDDIEEFIGKWTTALEKAARGATRVADYEAKREREELRLSVRGNPGVRALASNPLLLTILALMKRQGVELPERRVELYQAYVETLLKHWNLARSLAGRAGRDLDVVETTRILAPLALWIHRNSPGVGLVKEGDLQHELEHIYLERGHKAPDRAARDFLQDVRQISSLLIDRGGRQYGFLHLTFQEYLSAIALAQKGQQDITPIVEEMAAHVSDDTWREVSLLCIGFLGIVQQRDEAAGAVLEALLEEAPGTPGDAALLAGEAACDAGTGGITPQSRNKVMEALLASLIDDQNIKPVRRAAIGDVLANIGDPRPGVTSVDDMEFCLVPAGRFNMGSDDYEDEQPEHECNVEYDYWIGRFPVTLAQYREYIEARERSIQTHPGINDVANHPVVLVSWYDAMAFCDWLTKRWQDRGILAPGLGISLPSEPEWEKAVKGGFRIPVSPYIDRGVRNAKPDLCANPNPERRYPWGDKLEPNCANYGDTRIRKTSAVGCFHGGKSPYGCEEMSGNV